MLTGTMTGVTNGGIMTEEDDYTPTNRQKSRQATKSKYWCNCCDAALVGDWGKCPVCGSMRKGKERNPQ